MRRTMLSVALTLSFLLTEATVVVAQSGSRTYPPPGSAPRTSPPAGSDQRVEKPAPLALEGYCPVSIIEMKKWVKGDPSQAIVYDGKTYLFANANGKKMFTENLVKYVPALGGDCVIALVEMGKRVPGNIRHASFYKDRLYLFSNADALKMFQAEPRKYADADLAYGGQCVVCRVGMQRDVPGKTELTTIYKGFRYLFASEDQRREFLANPARYEFKPEKAHPTENGSATGTPPAGSNTRPPAGSGSGSR